MTSLLFDGPEWDFDTLRRTYDAIEEIAVGDLGLDVYPNQIEIISWEQMLDAYSAIGMPLMYRHWSFGKRFARESRAYRKGLQGLAYEIVINSSPCISYNMEENTMPMQALVMAHAAFGHNHFFKNNYLFRQWTKAESILDYMAFARDYIAACEEKHGVEAVEAVLDSAHALMDQGVFRYRRPPRLSQARVDERRRERQAYDERTFDDLWRTVPDLADERDDDDDGPDSDAGAAERRLRMKLPEENVLYFLEKQSPVLETWQREILRIVRVIAQYFYPQKQTKVMNEGCATFVHYYIANKLFDQGRISEGALLEILHSHSNVVFQPGFDDPRFSQINPYALGFAMMQDICRIVEKPTAEDREWFPDIAGSGDWRPVLRHAWANFRDESFIQQYLSPHLIRQMRLFTLQDREDPRNYHIEAIHEASGYRRVRSALARNHDASVIEPDVQVVDADLKGDRVLRLRHTMLDGVPLGQPQAAEVMRHLRRLWGYEVRLEGVDPDSGERRYEISTEGMR